MPVNLRGPHDTRPDHAYVSPHLYPLSPPLFSDRAPFRFRGVTHTTHPHAFMDALFDDDIESDDMEWEELLLQEDEDDLMLQDEPATLVIPRSRMNADSTRGNAQPDAEDGPLVPLEDMESMSWEAFPCPDLWTLEPEHEEADGVQDNAEHVTRRRAGFSVPTRRGRVDRSRSVSFDEERRLIAMRNHLRRCLERFSAIRERYSPSRDTESSSELPIPAYTSFLTPGLEFQGYQRCLTRSNRNASPHSVDDWVVHAQIRRYDVSSGYLSGTMAAYVKNNAPVETFWEGEIIDNKNHTFRTNKWSADVRTDVAYWTKFSAFRELKSCMLSKTWSTPLLKDYPYIFMRWKETHFITKTEQQLLTIQGFYYVCLCRQTGEITGYYYDPDCHPFQELELTPDRRGRSGFAFSFGEFI